ncbi:MAG: efflux RND transporter periplasmic adaptor subunit [Chitinophagaceae bacterium]|nr:efflux RND transporter periplasmic adaptor subunit [Chitinophagaceae bacterium]
MIKKKKSKNPTVKIAVISLGVVIILVIGAKWLGWIGKKEEIKVHTSKVESKSIEEKVSASGTVYPIKEIKITPDVAGEIVELLVEEGEEVIPGKLLIKIRPDNFQSALERVVANLNQQKANLSDAEARLDRSKSSFTRLEQEYKRQEKLYKEKVISESDWETAVSNYNIAIHDIKSAEQSVESAKYVVQSIQASVDEANENLRRTTVRSPSNGIISKLNVEQGERVVGTSQMAGTEMLRIADLNEMEVRVDVNENDIVRVNIHDSVQIDLDSYSHLNKKFLGVVTQIANTAKTKITADAVTEFEVHIKILNESFQDLVKNGIKYPLRPGMTATVDIITEKKQNILSVPLSAVTTRNPGDSTSVEENIEKTEESTSEVVLSDLQQVIFKNENNVAKMISIKTGISDFENIEIIEGLKEGDEIITGPFLILSKKLKNGDNITVIKKTNKKESKKE